MLNSQLESISVASIGFTADNVRTVTTSNASDKSLMASIKVKGVLQNIAVYKEGKKYFAVAGGRRLAACKKLIEDKALPKDHKIVCRVVDKADSVGVSLSENIHRERMHPADEFKAFSNLVDQGNSIKSIANEYGLKQIEVRQRLEMAAVADKIIESYKSGDIDLETVMAFTLEQDKEKQIEFFDLKKGTLTAWNVRNHFTHETITSDNYLAKFVGGAAYKKAGGAVMPDLFSDKNYWVDTALVSALATKKMELLVEKYVADGWKWAEFSIEQHSNMPSVISLDADESAIPKNLIAKRETLDKEHEELEAQIYGDRETELTEEEETKIDEKIDALTVVLEKLDAEIESHLFFTKEQRASGGVFLNVSNSGELNENIGLMKRSDIKKEPAQSGEVEVAPKEEGISQALGFELTRYAHQLTQLELISNPEQAALMYQFELCYSSLSDVNHWKWSSMFSSSHNDQVSDEESTQDSLAYNALRDAVTKIDRSWIKKNVESSFIAFSKLTPKKRAVVFGSVVSTLANDVSGRESEQSLQRELNKRTGFDRSQYWRPTAANYFGRVARGIAENVASGLFGKKWTGDQSSLNKKQFATAVVARFGDSDLTAKQKGSADTWLPEELK